jgi:hypothetical protein
MPCTEFKLHVHRIVRWLNHPDFSVTGNEAVKAFLYTGWDFMDESAKGTEDIWWILEGRDYPRFWREAAEQ